RRAAQPRDAAPRRAHRDRDAGGDPRPDHLGAVAFLPQVLERRPRAAARRREPGAAFDHGLDRRDRHRLALRRGEPRAHGRLRRALNRAGALLANLETVVMSFLQPAATVLVLFLAWRLSQAAAGDVQRGAISAGTFVAFHAALFALLGGVGAIVSTALGLLHLK